MFWETKLVTYTFSFLEGNSRSKACILEQRKACSHVQRDDPSAWKVLENVRSRLGNKTKKLSNTPFLSLFIKIKLNEILPFLFKW